MGSREVVSLPPSCDLRSGQRSTSPAAFPQRPGRRAGYWLPPALHCLSLVWRVEGPVSRCPYSPCRSPSLEKGFHYTSESVSSGLKSDPDGLSCIWALFFVGPKVAGLRNACCLGLFQIKSRIKNPCACFTKARTRAGGSLPAACSAWWGGHPGSAAGAARWRAR